MNIIYILVVSVEISTMVLGVPVKENSGLSNSRMSPSSRASRSKDCNCVCGLSNRQMRVIGGNVTKAHEFPWLAGLSKGGEFYCGATIITRKHLLTAAHCVKGIDTRHITVAIGDHDRQDKNRFSKIQVRRIKKANPHRFFDAPSYNNDIAVLTLDHPVDFDDPIIQPACIPEAVLGDHTGKLAIVAGWGRTEEEGSPSQLPRKVVVPIWSKKDCYNSGYGEFKLSENMFCAGYAEGKVDSCQGDSGGPLHIKDEMGIMKVVGIVSWGRGCGRPSLPGIYTKLENYLDWLQDALEGECLCPPPTFSSRRA